jgi:hypothetical protein
MEYINDSTIRRILNLQGSPLIHKSIADRQIEVIRKGYNYLSQEGNNALYIADEVGLGKTYIALGIASLLRHFSTNPETHQDVIIVPKNNLQLKWRKEILQFSNNNYQLLDNRVKSVIGKPTGEIQIHHQLEAIAADVPTYHLYRSSSFSFGLSIHEKTNLIEELQECFIDPVSIAYLEQAKVLGYFREQNKGLLKKFCAYLMAITNPTIELLIVDEGHNFKTGPGSLENAEVAARNAVASRFFGLKMNTEEDVKIFSDFPELKNQIKPKVQKLIVLSATPKTYSLIEIKNQLDCFLPNHILSGCKREKEIQEKLPYFLIRGKMEYTIRDVRHTRNQCRFEHRNGNAIKAKDAAPIQLQEGEQALFMGLLQYNTIRHLNQKHNGNVEMGMLAGFETYRLDAQKFLKDEPEYEDTRSTRINKSQDQPILEQLMQSWSEEFVDAPPHPKQSVMVDALLEMMKRGEKALIFVRRVASAYELEQRLMQRWQKEVIAPELKNHWSKVLPSVQLNALINAFEEHEENKQLREHIDDIIASTIERLLKNRFGFDFQFIEQVSANETSIENALKTGLYYLYHHIKIVDKGGSFKDGLMRQTRVSKFKVEWLELAYQLLKKEYDNWSPFVDDGIKEHEEEEPDAYFFHSYFQTPAAGPFKRKSLYQKDWFDPNYFLINKHFQLFDFNEEALKKQNIHAKDQSDLKEIQEIFIKHSLKENYVEKQLNESDYPGMLFKNNLITTLMTDLLSEEVSDFIQEYSTKGIESLIHELRTLSTILRSILRNGSGFLPVFIAAHAQGNIETNFLILLKKKDSIFQLVTNELKAIVRDYRLLRAVNFPDSDRISEIENKLLYQTPIKGLTGSNKSKGKWATQFRMPGFPYALITTDIFREGEDLHTYCDNIYHYGIAWNCTDMEQRTGRIDRINSLSHRAMSKDQAVNFDNQIHVFYPYVQKTLEVNQVHKLFTNINSFVKSFDIVDSINDDGLVETNLKVEEMPSIIDKPLHSQFEHDKFKGDVNHGTIKQIQNRIGKSKEEVLQVLKEINKKLNTNGEYYFTPSLDENEFIIRAVMKLNEDDERRGPFQIKVQNDDVPGNFKIEVAAYLFKQSSKIMKVVANEKSLEYYKVIEIEDYYALSYIESLNEILATNFYERLYALLRYTDHLERQSTNFDLSVFE